MFSSSVHHTEVTVTITYAGATFEQTSQRLRLRVKSFLVEEKQLKSRTVTKVDDFHVNSFRSHPPLRCWHRTPHDSARVSLSQCYTAFVTQSRLCHHYLRIRSLLGHHCGKMKVTATLEGDQIFSLEVSEDLELENFKALVEFESGVPSSQIVIFHNGVPLRDPNVTLNGYGVKDGDVLLIQRSLQSMQQRPPLSGNDGVKRKNIFV